MIFRKLLFLIIIATFGAYTFAQCNTHFRTTLTYKCGSNSDTHLLLKFYFIGTTGTETDEINVLSDTTAEIRHSFGFTWLPTMLYVEIYNDKMERAGQYTLWDSTMIQDCTGLGSNNMFSGSHCIDILNSDNGILCGRYEFNFENAEDSGNITCKSVQKQIEKVIFTGRNTACSEKLQLVAPCHFQYLNSEQNVHWMYRLESDSWWSYAGYGFVLYPGVLFNDYDRWYNKRIWFKVWVDTQFITGKTMAESPVYGPIRIFSAMEPYSAWLDNPDSCNRPTDLKFEMPEFQTDSKFEMPEYQIFFYNGSKDSQSVSHGLLRTGVNALSDMERDSGFNNSNGELELRKGLYSVYFIYSSIDQDCRILKRSLIHVDTVRNEKFYLNLKILDTLKCHGATNGEVLLELVTNSSAYRLTFNGDSVAFATSVLDNLCAGKYIAKASIDGCIINSEVILEEPMRLLTDLPSDTTLCKNQSWTLDIGKGLPDSSFCIFGKDTISGPQWNLDQPGKYVIIARYRNGCVYSDTTNIKIQNSMLEPTVLMTGTSGTLEWLKAIDVSNPVGDTLVLLGLNAALQSRTDGKHAWLLRFRDTGKYDIPFLIRFGLCGYLFEKEIRIVPDQDSIYQRLLWLSKKHENTFIIKPNPGHGKSFTVGIELSDSSDIRIECIDGISGKTVEEKLVCKYLKGDIQFVLKNALYPGIHYLKLTSDEGILYTKYMVVE